jgi:SAM-dependent methyltransferase
VKVNDRQFYERFWSDFDSPAELQVAIHVESRRPLLKLLGRHLPQGPAARTLEVGCGTALDSCLLASAHGSVRAYACDLSERAVSVAQQNARGLGVPLTVFTGDLTALPFADGYFDLVFSQGVLEHFEEPGPAVREQVRVLRSGGTLVVDVPQKYNVYTLRKHQAMGEKRWPWGWETEYSVRQLRTWAPGYGLEFSDAVGYQHGRFVDRLLMHPHRTLHRQLAKRRSNGARNGYRPGMVARQWENACDWLDARLGPYLAINVAVAYRKRDS